MSTVILDTITGKSTATTITIGSTPVVSASANSMTIRGEGSNQTSIQQGLAKAWINFKGTDTVTVNDSFNHSSLTDHGNGHFQNTLATALGNANYSITGMCGRSPNVGGTEPAFVYTPDDVAAPTTTTYRYYSLGSNGGSLQNQDRNFNAVLGDLA